MPFRPRRGRDRECDGGTAKGRDAGFQIGVTSDPDQDYDVTYGYDGTGRLNRITGPGLSANGAVYGYVTNTDRVGSLAFKDGADATAASVTRVYGRDATPVEARDLLVSVENRKESSPSATVSKYTYGHDGFGRRGSVVNEGSAFAPQSPYTGLLSKYGYNDRDELLTSRRYQDVNPDSPGPEVTSEARTYAYDNLGNRTTHADAEGLTTYRTTNELNQYEEVLRPVPNPNTHESVGHDADGNLVGSGLVAGWPTHPRRRMDGSR